MNFQQFTQSPYHNQWIEEGTLRIYVRKPGPVNPYYQLANMANSQPGQGDLAHFLDKYEKEHQFFIENILNDRLVTFFTKRGYKIAPGQRIVPCMVGPNG